MRTINREHRRNQTAWRCSCDNRNRATARRHHNGFFRLVQLADFRRSFRQHYFERKNRNAMSIAILEAAHLRKSFGRKLAVADVSFSMQTGEVIGLLGPNGAGKTTVFYMIAGFLKPSAGTVHFDRKPIDRLPMFKRAMLGISYLPQEASIFRRMTVEENILAVLEARSSLSPAGRREKARMLMEEFGIQHVAKQPAYTLSGGERRRTEIARALAIEPKFLLLDETIHRYRPHCHSRDQASHSVALIERNRHSSDRPQCP